MKKTGLIFIHAALLPLFWGCASFNSGDIKVDREIAREMLQDKATVPFADIEVSWRNFPYRSASDSIGEGSISRPKRIKPLPVAPEDAAKLEKKARDIFSDAGLLDRRNGSGMLRLELTSFGRWTYRDLFRSFLVDTGFIMIIPASLRVNYYMTADFSAGGRDLRVETEARNKTTFHLLLAPLYPFFSPGAKEGRLLKQMLWRSATDVYSKLSKAGSAPGQPPPKATEPENGEQPLSGPPVRPARTWLPGQPLDGPASAPAAAPEKPDRDWAVPKPVRQAAPAPAPEQPAPSSPADMPEEPRDD